MTADDVVVTVRCVVCGSEHVGPTRGWTINSLTGESRQRDNGTRALYSDGVQAGACHAHTPDETRTAWVLTCGGLRLSDGSRIPPEAMEEL